MSNHSFDLAVIGGGPGGYVAAIRASQLGMKVALIEAEHLGGVCLNWGCIPTKALLRSAEAHRLIRHAEDYGIKVSGLEIDFKKVIERSRAVSKQLSQGVKSLLKKNKVTVFEGWGRLDGSGAVAVEKNGAVSETVSAPHIIIATGARARVLPGLEPDGTLVWTYKEAMVPEEIPEKLLVVGSGAIGTEFASFYNDLGADVTLVELVDRILPVEDEEISAFARKQFEKQGLKIETGASVTKLDKSKSNVKATIKGANGEDETRIYDRVIVAVGIVANTDDLGLEKTGVRLDRGRIMTDEWLCTDEPGIYAIGDVAGAPWLAHKASHEGVICVEKIAGAEHVHPLETHNVPACTYSHPQIASVGYTEAAAKEAGYDVRVGRFPFIGNGKALALGEPEGLVKTVFDARTGELLGAHMVGAEVTELIQGCGIARTLEATEAELMQTVFPHPTLSEMMHESVLDAYGKAIHI